MKIILFPTFFKLVYKITVQFFFIGKEEESKRAMRETGRETLKY